MKKSLISALVITLLNATPSHAFNNVISFGDSLSDGGVLDLFGVPSRYLAGSDTLLYNEILSKQFANKELVISTQGGNNFSVSGATASNTPLLIHKTEHQVQDYLNRNNGRADKNSMYLFWVGANDISTDVEMSLFKFDFGKLFDQGPNYLLSDAPQALSRQVGTLLQHGAGLVVVPNLPNAGLSPWTATALFGFTQMFSGGNLLDLPGLYAQQDLSLRQQEAVYGEAQRQAAIIRSLSEVLQNYGLKLPQQLIANVYGTLLGMEQRLTEQFNYDLERSLASLEGNIAYIDTNSLFQEMIDDPLRYGFTNILVPVCQIGVPAPFCDSTQPSWHDEQTYLFSDWFHPSPEAHIIIAEYIASVINAPLLASKLVEPAKQLMYGHNTYLVNQLTMLRERRDSTTHYQLFGGYNGHYSSADLYNSHGRELSGRTNIGVLIHANDFFSIGGALSMGQAKNNLGPGYRASYDDKSLSLLTQFEIGQSWLSTQVSMGDITFSKIQRSFKLGKAIRTENATTKVNHVSGSINAGHDFYVNDSFSHGPQATLLYRSAKVNHFSERSNSSSAMRFGNQRFSDTYVSAGWRFAVQDKLISPFMEINYLHPLNEKNDEINAGLKTTATSFTQKIDSKNTSSLNIKLGTAINVSDTVNAFAMIDIPDAKRELNDIYYMAGVSFNF